jgi:hypothetical protein
MSRLFKLCALLLLVSACGVPAALAQPTPTISPLDPSHPVFKMVGEVSQIRDGNLVGNAWFHGKDGCFAVTNYHVAYGKGKSKLTNKVTGEKVERIDLVENQAVGHKVKFDFDFDSASSSYRRTSIATVVALGNYDDQSMSGAREDIVILRLETCAGPSHAGLETDRTAENERNPQGRMLIVSSSRSPEGRKFIGIFKGCRATIQTPGAGLVGTSCPTRDGMSGSMLILEETMRVVGINVSRFQFDDGTKAGVAISAKYLNRFLDEHFSAAPAK